MDWREITRIVEEAQTLEAADRAAFLTQMILDAPASAPTVLRCLGLPTDSHEIDPDFMRTALQGHRGEAPGNTLAAGAELGPWRVLRCIDSGGMGSVYEAERADGLYAQRAALKLIHSVDDALITAFERERQRLAQMDHPGIARIIDGGEAPDGRPFLVMEFVEGQPIDRALGALGASYDEIVRTFLQVCDAVAHAHGRLILHQDIKPANVLLDATGKPRLIDFGIASDLSEQDGVSSRALTVLYAAPELLFAERLSVRTDIFSLGVLLHCLLVGRVPEREPSGGVQVDNDTLDDRDLSAILKRATALSPQDRYGAVGALSQDLLAWLESRPVDARQGGAFYRSGKFLRRYPLGNALAATAVLALVGGLTVSLNFGAQARQAAERAESARAQAQWNARQTERQNRITTAYADALQRLSGAGMDVERITELLLEYLETQLSNRAQDPESAALAAFAIGRHFLSRNDYVTARRVLEPWVEEGYGDAELVRMGWANLAYVYQHGGEAERAEAAFRHAAALADPYTREGPGYASTLAQIARYSGARADRELAEQALLRLTTADSSPWIRMTMNNQLFQLRSRFGDNKGAYDAIRAAVEIVDAHPSIELQGKDTNRLNLAEVELFSRSDLDAALEQIRRARQNEELAKGDSRESARAQELEGLIARERGDLVRARDLLTRALDLHRRFGGSNSIYAHRAASGLIMTLEDLGDQAGADALLRAVHDDLPSAASLRVAEAYLTLRRQGPDAASSLLQRHGAEFVDADRVMSLQHALRRLERERVAWRD
jgi:tRNA A-37 threonylcarbamoyl transferase component Bud32/Tfp pilus assembly protein PilF